jgi:undecaprenyl-diphosphatase
MSKLEISSGSPQSLERVPSRRVHHGTWASAAVTLGLFVPLALAVAWGSRPYFDWDLAVSQSIQSVRGPGLETLMHGVSLADNNILGPAVLVSVAGLVLVARRARREAAVLVGVLLVGQALWVVCGQLVGRPRPSPALVQVRLDEGDVHGFPSFPSGHTVYYTAFFGFLWFLTFTRVRTRRLRWPLLGSFGGLVLLVGIARIYLGAHWVSDVVGGYLLGGAVLAAGIGLYRRWSGVAAEQTEGEGRTPGHCSQ